MSQRMGQPIIIGAVPVSHTFPHLCLLRNSSNVGLIGLGPCKLNYQPLLLLRLPRPQPNPHFRSFFPLLFFKRSTVGCTVCYKDLQGNNQLRWPPPKTTDNRKMNSRSQVLDKPTLVNASERVPHWQGITGFKPALDSGKDLTHRWYAGRLDLPVSHACDHSLLFGPVKHWTGCLLDTNVSTIIWFHHTVTIAWLILVSSFCRLEPTVVSTHRRNVHSVSSLFARIHPKSKFSRPQVMTGTISRSSLDHRSLLAHLKEVNRHCWYDSHSLLLSLRGWWWQNRMFGTNWGKKKKKRKEEANIHVYLQVTKIKQMCRTRKHIN